MNIKEKMTGDVIEYRERIYKFFGEHEDKFVYRCDYSNDDQKFLIVEKNDIENFKQALFNRKEYFQIAIELEKEYKKALDVIENFRNTYEELSNLENNVNVFDIKFTKNHVSANLYKKYNDNIGRFILNEENNTRHEITAVNCLNFYNNVDTSSKLTQSNPVSTKCYYVVNNDLGEMDYVSVDDESIIIIGNVDEEALRKNHK